MDVYQPGEGELLEIAQAAGPLALLLGPVQGRHENGHQHRDHRDDDEQLD
jgi:hypothetical protein